MRQKEKLTFHKIRGCAREGRNKLAPEKILMVIQCALVTTCMPRCDLLNVIFATEHRHLRFFVYKY